MKYALGNMLNGAGGLNADQLALDLQFAADKTLTARRGPTPILTRGSTGTYVGSNGLIQTAAVNAARFDHDPVTLASRGLLIEEGRTNLALQSETLGTTWAQVNISVSSNVAVSPDGNTTADKLVENTVNGGHGIDQSVTFTAAAHTFSVYAKADGRSWLRMTIASVANSTWFDVVNGTVGTIGAGITASIQNAGNGWWRCSVTVTATAGSLQNFIRIATGNNNTTYAGDGTSGLLLWGAQLEAGSFATSYIPTTTSALARSADVCSITGANFTGMYNQPEGTLFADVTPQTVNQLSSVFAINTSTYQNAHIIYKIDSTFNVAGRRWGGQTSVGITPQTAIATSTDAAVSRSRLAYAYKLNDFAFAASGSLVGTDTSGTIPSPTAMRIGARDDGLAINGHLAAIRYYKKRLDNSKLASITV